MMLPGPFRRVHGLSVYLPSQSSSFSTTLHVYGNATSSRAAQPWHTASKRFWGAYNAVEALLGRRIGRTFLCAYRASAEGKKYVIKNVIPGEFEYNRDLQKKVSFPPSVRTVVDNVQARGFSQIRKTHPS